MGRYSVCWSNSSPWTPKACKTDRHRQNQMFGRFGIATNPTNDAFRVPFRAIAGGHHLWIRIKSTNSKLWLRAIAALNLSKKFMSAHHYQRIFPWMAPKLWVFLPLSKQSKHPKLLHWAIHKYALQHLALRRRTCSSRLTPTQLALLVYCHAMVTSGDR